MLVLRRDLAESSSPHCGQAVSSVSPLLTRKPTHHLPKVVLDGVPRVHGAGPEPVEERHVPRGLERDAGALVGRELLGGLDEPARDGEALRGEVGEESAHDRRVRVCAVRADLARGDDERAHSGKHARARLRRYAAGCAG